MFAWWIVNLLTIGGASNFVTFIDDHSRKVWTFVLKFKESFVFSSIFMQVLTEKNEWNWTVLKHIMAENILRSIWRVLQITQNQAWKVGSKDVSTLMKESSVPFLCKIIAKNLINDSPSHSIPLDGDVLNIV